ncbi:preprotein translocase subunit SecY [Lentisphaerota bacterium ZTH]|nr:preprotein translocase subunit SecY [Lentisphaerota bacterium]WET06019.1 preprotein translocase subunit SecY [Lentisphaerota bacterium ZTH]
MFAAFWNTLKVKELRNRLLFTAGIIVLARFAANIPCPGIDPAALQKYFVQFSQNQAGGVFNMFDLFSGGALQKFALATLGIMPYITASIIMQLLVPVLPSLEKLSREGDAGRQKINQFTRYLTVLVCLVQGTIAATTMVNPERIGLPRPEMSLIVGDSTMFVFMTVLVLTCCTMILMWLGEQITERGIGNGASIIITINIVARMPAAIMQLVEMVQSGGTGSGTSFKPVQLLILLVIFGAVTAATIMLTQGYRRVPIQMVRKTIGNSAQSSSTYMPLKVNFSGVMPIIFAGAILMIPGAVFPALKWYQLAAMFAYGSVGYMVIYALFILAFAYFWVANQFNPIQISDNLKQQGAYIPGLRPGQPTADFLDSTMTKVTFAGSIFLMGLAIFPMLLYNIFRIPFMVASFFGGTSLLIMVGVVLDTLSQLESHLTMRNYDGFLKRGRIRNRSGR